MNSFHKFAAISFAALSFTSFDASAAIDNAASVVLLRTSCNDGAGGTLNNCFTSTIALDGWIEATRKPTGANPLEVQIGPGSHQAIRCGVAGSAPDLHVTYRGSGTDMTIINKVYIFPTCTNAVFQDMSIVDKNNDYGYAVTMYSNGAQTTTWNNVKAVGDIPWDEVCLTLGATKSKHYWFGSKIEGGSSSYRVRCDESWFIGSEITNRAALGNSNIVPFDVRGGELHVYGSVIRTLGSGATAGTGSMGTVSATGGETHIHGTGIDVIATDGASAGIAVFAASNGALIHANASAYNLRTGSGGTVTRIANNGGHVHAAYLWEHIPDTDGNPATVNTNFTSANGADQTTVTVGTSDGHPHAAVYSSSCPTTARWYDQVDKVCRSQ